MIGHNRVLIPRVHHVRDGEQQLAPECTAGVEERIVLLLEVARLHERHRDRVAHCERRCRGAGRCEPERARLSLDTDVDVEVRAPPELGFTSTAHCDNPRADAVDDREDVYDFVRLAAVRDGDNDIVRRHHAKIAVKRLGGVHEERGRPRTRKGRRDLAPDVAGFAHARDDNARLAVQDCAHRRLEIIVNALCELCDCLRLELKRLDCLFANALCHMSLLLQLFAYNLVDSEGILQEVFEFVEIDHVRPVRQRLRRVVMHLEEESVNARTDSRTHKVLDVLALSP